MSLPKPETKTAADRASNWPTDYDVRRRRELAAAREKAERPDVFRDSGPARDSDPLSPDQMAPGRANRPSRGSTSGPYHPTNESGAPYSPSALGYVGGIFDSMFGGDKEEYKPFTGEPPRTALVEPPAGYQTPSPKEPYGVGKQKAENAALFDPMTLGYEQPRQSQ